MATDIFAKIGDIKGESLDSKHKDEIEVLSFSWGISNASKVDAKPGKVSPARRVSLQDFSIVKMIDSSSPVLFQKCCQGQHISDATITVRKAGEKPVEYLKIKLVDVIISSVQANGAFGGGAPMEQVNFSFASVDIAAADEKGAFVSEVSCGGMNDSFFDGR